MEAHQKKHRQRDDPTPDSNETESVRNASTTPTTLNEMIISSIVVSVVCLVVIIVAAVGICCMARRKKKSRDSKGDQNANRAVAGTSRDKRASFFAKFAKANIF